MKRFVFIRNAGLDVGWLETLFANLVYQIGLIRFRWRGPLLSEREYSISKDLLQPGDIVLVGQSRYVSSLFIRGPFTHSLININEDVCIEARGEGVRLTSYRRLFGAYDRLAILRVHGLTPEKAKGVIDFALERIAEPYDFWFDYEDRRAWFCTELICAALEDQGVELPMCTKPRTTPPNPEDFYMFGTDVVYSSTCITEVGGVLQTCSAESTS